MKMTLAAFLFLISTTLYAQVSAETDSTSKSGVIEKLFDFADNTVDFYYEKEAVGSFIVSVNFSKLENSVLFVV